MKDDGEMASEAHRESLDRLGSDLQIGRSRNDEAALALPAIRSRSASLGPGYLHLLSGEEQRTMFQLWVIFFHYLQIHPTLDEGKLNLAHTKKFASDFLAAEPAGALDCERMLDHPLAATAFRQAATDDLDTMVLRFLRARKWSLPDAFAMLIECFHWRHVFGVERLVREGEGGIRRELLERGKFFVWEEDQKGRLVCYVRGCRHDKNAQSLEDSMTYTVWFLETGRLLRRYDEQLLTVVVDLKDVGVAAFDLPYVRFALRCLQDYYPETLGCCLIMNAPWFFWAFWATVKPFLDPVVASKISFIKAAEVTHYLQADKIPRDFSMGTSLFKYDYTSYLPRSPTPQKDDVAAACIAPDTEIVRLEGDFVRQTVEIASLLHSTKAAAHTLQAALDARNSLKRQLRWGFYSRLIHHLPPNMFHRWGVLDQRGRVQWDHYTLPGSTASKTGT